MTANDEQPPLVAHVIHSFSAGGLENGLVNIINRTPASRYRHAIVCLTESGAFEERLKNPVLPIVSLHRSPGHDFGLYWSIWRALRSLKPAIVHTRNLSTLEAQIPAFFIKGLKTVPGEHGRDVFDLEGKNKKYNALRKVIRPMVGCYIAVSNDLKSWLLETIRVRNGKVRQIYNGVDQKIFTPRGSARKNIAPKAFLSDDVIMIGTVGRLAAVKDQATLIEAFNLLVCNTPNAEKRLRLVVAGDGPLREKLELLVSKLGLEELVWMTGDRNDIPDILRLLDVFVLPSIGEGISNTILEAMATALPVVATRVGGNPELIEHGKNGYLVPPGDPKRLARSIEQLLTDGVSRKSMGQAGLRKVQEQFNWDTTVENYLEVYDQLLAERTAI